MIVQFYFIFTKFHIQLVAKFGKIFCVDHRHFCYNTKLPKETLVVPAQYLDYQVRTSGRRGLCCLKLCTARAKSIGEKFPSTFRGHLLYSYIYSLLPRLKIIRSGGALLNNFFHPHGRCPVQLKFWMKNSQVYQLWAYTSLIPVLYQYTYQTYTCHIPAQNQQ